MGVILRSAIDVLPIVIFLFAFQRIVIGQPLANGKKIAVGFVFVVVGLGLFLLGLERSLFPLGRLMAQQLTDPEFLFAAAGKAVSDLSWHDYFWVYLFAAATGFSTTLAEPALIAVWGYWCLGVTRVGGYRCRNWCQPGLLPHHRWTATTLLYCGRIFNCDSADDCRPEADRAPGL